ncbi:hypothetical protein [Haloactinopolyspora sp.]|uniref:hypothetical protein n=1 Tax=Haloactinopolyspora sp. TaxID=1966353 RepID=UPI00261682AB|nr:hypothetical protein [Haloactinopolyspora sp.]
MNASDHRSGRKSWASAFDIRLVIAALLAVFGVIILLMGLFGTSQADIDRAGGTNLNTWTGAGLLVAAAVFAVWARLRPVPVADDDANHDDVV